MVVDQVDINAQLTCRPRRGDLLATPTSEMEVAQYRGCDRQREMVELLGKPLLKLCEHGAREALKLLWRDRAEQPRVSGGDMRERVDRLELIQLVGRRQFEKRLPKERGPDSEQLLRLACRGHESAKEGDRHRVCG